MIRIITDSAADFSQSELQALSVRCVPMTISFGEDSYTDGVDLPQEIFWQRMEAGQNPKTSQPSPDAFLREFEAAKDAGDSVVCILISSALSGTMQSALIAAGMVEDLDIALVDSLTATAGLLAPGDPLPERTAAAARSLAPARPPLVSLDLPYAPDGDPAHRLDVFVPGGSTTPRPLVVFIHGGAWTHGSKAVVRGGSGEHTDVFRDVLASWEEDDLFARVVLVGEGPALSLGRGGPAEPLVDEDPVGALDRDPGHPARLQPGDRSAVGGKDGLRGV